MTDLHVVLPDTVRRPDRPSGGNTYDRRICDGLVRHGWIVHEHLVPGAWPHPDAESRVALARVVDDLPVDAVVLVDGLVGSCSAEVLVPRALRVRLVVLVHMPLGQSGVRATSGRTRVTTDAHSDAVERTGSTDGSSDEGRVLSEAAGVIATSLWTQRRLVELYGLDPTHIHVARPGVDPAPLASGTPTGGRLVCAAAVTQGKGHDALVDALGRVCDLPWRCVCAGSLALEPKFVDELRRRVRGLGLADRVHLVGPLSVSELDHAYAAADLVVLASHAETYGMVVTEALARGVPVIATSVGGVPEALGTGPDGNRPGLLVRPGDAEALGEALRAWLTDPGLRERLRDAARARRVALTGWEVTTQRVSEVLRRVSA